MIDIDNFKQVNDTLGHLCGDQLLQAFARRLRLLLRASDIIGRVGGDEFIVLLSETPLVHARQLAERLCAQIAASPLETESYGAFPITISAGVAEYFDCGADTLDPVIILADKGLYQAKAQGRNQACVFDPLIAE